MRLLFLPGLGADSRLFTKQQDEFKDAEYIQWPGPQGGDSLSTYVQRMVTRLNTNKETILIGASLGGIIASEMAATAPLAGVIHLGSATQRQAIALDLRLGLSFLRAIPPPPLPARMMGTSLMAHRFGAHDKSSQNIFAAMAKDTSPKFIRWALSTLSPWQQIPASQAPLVRIHGDKDRIIKPLDVTAEGIVPGAGHLLTLTHAEMVNQRLRWAIDRIRAHRC